MKRFLITMAVGALSMLMAAAADEPARRPGSPEAPPGRPGDPGGGRGGPSGRRPDFGPEQRGNFPGRGGIMGLDEQQRGLFQEAMQKERDKTRALEEELRAAQKELVNAIVMPTYDKDDVRTKAEAVAKIQVELTLLRAEALAHVAPTLKPEQKQQLADSPLGMMLLGGGGGFPGGRGPGFGPGEPGFGPRDPGDRGPGFAPRGGPREDPFQPGGGQPRTRER